MSIDTQACSYPLTQTDMYDPETVERCGRATTCVLSKGRKIYPRCSHHAGPKVRDLAVEQGYEVHYLEPHPETT